MKKNGFTIYDILGLIGILALSALIILPKISNALKEYDNKDEIYNEIINNYKVSAERYGNDKKEEVKNSEIGAVSINDLIENGYILITSDNNEVIDIRDNYTKMNNIKFKLVYNEDEDRVSAEIIG